MHDVAGGSSSAESGKPRMARLGSMKSGSVMNGAGKPEMQKLANMKAGDLKATAKAAEEDLGDGLINVEEFVEMSRAIFKVLERRQRLIVASLKIITTFYQIISSLPFVLSEVPWPTMFSDISSTMSFINLDIAKMPSLSCLAPSRFLYRLILYIFGPFAIFLVLIATGVLGSFFFKKHPKLAEFHDGIYYNLNVFLFLVYPIVSANAFSTFACANVDGVWLLKADYNVECFTGPHARSYTILVG